jgi:N-methylhydantoinase B
MSGGRPLPGELREIEGDLEWLSCKHVRSPIQAGDVWYHSWQGGGGYGDPLLRDPARVADDVERGAVSTSSAADIYGVVLTTSGGVDEAATSDKRKTIRAARLAAVETADVGDAVVSFSGSRRIEFGEALTVDPKEDSVSCPQCGHRHCGTGDNLLTHLGLVRSPLGAAGPVRGQAYDRGRFSLRTFVCRGCGGLVDVQVGLDGAPFSFARPKCD